jgi:predicted metalloprotease with PDZ domain
VPYGRGFMYLAKTDAEIRAHSQGKRRLEDVVVTLLDREHHAQSYTNSDWVALATRELGPTAKTEYDDMVAGVRIVPPGNTFGPCFTPQIYTTRLNDLGFDEKSLQGPQKHIVGLRPDSNAARAGLKEGDEVVSASPRDQDEPNADMTLTINRGGKTQQIRFKPEGKSVPAYRWIRSANVAEADCRY